jgi:hypothetical protein
LISDITNFSILELCTCLLLQEAGAFVSYGKKNFQVEWNRYTIANFIISSNYYSWISLCQTRLTRNFGQVKIFLKSRFKLSAFQLNLLLLSQISMCRYFGYLKVAFSPKYSNPFNLCSLCQNYKLSQLTNLSRCKQHGIRCLPRQMILILITTNYHL